MIDCIKLIQNIGRFENVSSGVSLTLGKFNVIYGENGRGKTTLTAILKSLGENEPAHILERHRLGASYPPKAVIDSSTDSYQFQDGAWTLAEPNVVVFDDSFVSRNVCSGIEIDNEHCKNLHELIVGAEGVALSEKLTALASSIDAHNREIRRLGNEIPVSVRGPLTVEDFCALEAPDDLNERIETSKKSLAAAKSADDIRKKNKFENFQLPKFDTDRLNSLLSEGLPELAAEAAEKVREHLSHAGQNAEAWVADGLPRANSVKEVTGKSDCPFCAQDLANSPVIEHYQGYFSDGYTALRNRVVDEGKRLSADFGSDTAAAYERAIGHIVDLRNFWKNFVDIPEIEIDTAATVRTLNAAREAVRAHLLAKHAAPFDTERVSTETKTLIEQYEVASKRHADIMELLEDVNGRIDLVKEKAAATDPSTLEIELKNLERVKLRHEEQYQSKCQLFLDEIESKKVTEKQRDAARNELNNYQNTIFPTYEDAINKYLEKFYAGFRLGSVSSRNTRSGSTCDYKVLIDNAHEVALSSKSGPSFRNTMSAGDRNTLALAFFFASLESDEHPSNRIVVIDDPMTSLDEHRSLTTRQEIRALADRVEQTIVMSHEKSFLCGLWEAADRVKRTAMAVVRSGSSSTLIAWDVNEDCITEHDRRHRLVHAYLETYSASEQRNVAVALRYILEAFCRVAYPSHFKPGGKIGQFADQCRRHSGTTDEILSSADSTELREILDYANKFHHDTNSAHETVQINDTELEQFAKRTMRFAQRS